MSSPSAWNGPLGLAPLGFLDLAPAPLIRTAAAAGFNSVALRARAAVPGGPEYPLLAGSPGLREIRDAMAETGVQVDLIELVPLHRDLDLEDVRGLLECAASIGALRVLCTGDDTDRHVVVRKFAQLCDMAAPLGMTVHLEFMRFRAGVQTLEDAVDVVVQADRPNGFIVLDVLHLMRAGGSAASLARAPRDRIAVVQLCDGPLSSPPPDKLADEARTDRRIPGEGEFPIAEMLRCLDPGVSLSLEIPLAGPRAAWPAVERMTLLANGARRHLAGIWSVPA